MIIQLNGIEYSPKAIFVNGSRRVVMDKDKIEIDYHSPDGYHISKAALKEILLCINFTIQAAEYDDDGPEKVKELIEELL